jgi:hypothetical protein
MRKKFLCKLLNFSCNSGPVRDGSFSEIFFIIDKTSFQPLPKNGH